MRQLVSVHISIPRQCHEDWNKMTPQQKGRYCDSCKKCVIDFTHYSDEELLNYFANNDTQQLCGRFSSAQLNRKIFKPPTRRKHFQWIMSLGFVVFLTNLFSSDAKAQEPIKKEWTFNNKHEQQNDRDEIPSHIKASEDCGDSITFDALGDIAIAITDYSLEGAEIEAQINLAEYNRSIDPRGIEYFETRIPKKNSKYSSKCHK